MLNVGNSVSNWLDGQCGGQETRTPQAAVQPSSASQARSEPSLRVSSEVRLLNGS